MNPVFDKKQIRGLNWKFWSCLKLIRPFALRIQQSLAQKAVLISQKNTHLKTKSREYMIIVNTYLKFGEKSVEAVDLLTLLNKSVILRDAF